MYNRFFVIALIVIGLGLPFANTAATGVGDVTIKINPTGPFPNIVHSCGLQIVEIWIRNDAPVYELSLGLQLSIGQGQFAVLNYGTLPSQSPILSIDDNASHAAFDGTLTVDASQLPNFIFLHGIASQTPLPVHNASTRIYSFMIETNGAWEGNFCVDNIVNPATGTWAFNDVQEYSPTYCGNQNNSINDPSAAARCFALMILPCMPPVITVKPPASATIGVCEPYIFQFDYVSEGAKCKGIEDGYEDDVAKAGDYGLWYARRGSITVTGLYQFTPTPTDTLVVDTIGVVNAACLNDEFVLTMTISHRAPQITLCNQLLRVKAGTSRAVQFNMTDSDLCESHVWTLEQLAPIAPQSAISINAETGTVSVVDADPADIGANFDYRLTCTDQFGKSASCAFALKIVDIVPGDADSNGLLTISDVVWLISYIFGGPIGEEIPIDRVDSDCNLMCNISDAVFLINYIFAGGPEPC